MPVDLYGSAASRALLARYGPKEMQARIALGTLRAGRAMVPIIRAEIRNSIEGHGHNPGMLARKVSARGSRASLVGVAMVRVGSTAPHNHLVIRGHRIVGHFRGSGRATTAAARATLRDSGRRTRANPFINRVEIPAWRVAGPIMRREVFGE